MAASDEPLNTPVCKDRRACYLMDARSISRHSSFNPLSIQVRMRNRHVPLLASSRALRQIDRNPLPDLPKRGRISHPGTSRTGNEKEDPSTDTENDQQHDAFAWRRDENK